MLAKLSPAKAGTHVYNFWLLAGQWSWLRLPIGLRGHGSWISDFKCQTAAGCASAFPRREWRPGFASLAALEEMRAQGRPGARCTRGLVCNCAQKMRTRAYRYRRSIPAFPAQWLYGLLRALPGERLFCHRHRRDTSRQLNASTATSGPHDFAVRSSHTRQSQLSRPPHPTARS